MDIIFFVFFSFLNRNDGQTVNGTALHEAVMCGKNEVVRLLLEADTDIQLCNDREQKVQQLLDGLNTSVAKQTKKLIRG